MTAIKKLQAVKRLIRLKRHWAINHMALSATGREVLPTSPRAVQWCVLGAWARVVGRYGDQDYGFLQQAAHEVGKWSPVAVNNELGHAATLRMLDRAIAIAKATEA